MFIRFLLPLLIFQSLFSQQFSDRYCLKSGKVTIKDIFPSSKNNQTILYIPKKSYNYKITSKKLSSLLEKKGYKISKQKAKIITFDLNCIKNSNYSFLKPLLKQKYLLKYPTMKIKSIFLTPLKKTDFLPKELKKIEIQKNYLKRDEGNFKAVLKNGKKVSFRYRIVALLGVFKANNNIQKDKIISPLDIKKEDITFRYIINEPVKDFVSAKKAARFIRKGEILSKRSIKEQTLLNKGDTVTALLYEDGISLEFDVVLLKDANLKDIVTVKNKRGKRFKAKVISKRRVEILE